MKAIFTGSLFIRSLFIASLLAASALAPLRGDAAPAPKENRGSLYGYINTPAFADGAKEFYLKKIASDEKRANLISQAKEDCAGRYEGTSVGLIELTHVIDTDKHPASAGAKNYTVGYETKADVRWLLVETISCSVHGGYMQSVLRAVVLSGTETQLVTYKFVNDKPVGSPQVSDLVRAYKIGAELLTDMYRIPYSEQ